MILNFIWEAYAVNIFKITHIVYTMPRTSIWTIENYMRCDGGLKKWYPPASSLEIHNMPEVLQW